MILFFVLLAIAALVGAAGAIRDLVRDGHRRVPERREAVWAADPARLEPDPVRV